MSRHRPRQVRPEIAAIPLIVLAAFAFRAKSLTAGVGGDEYSLLAMAGVMLDGGFPYADFWDVRPPLAYVWGLPSAYIGDPLAGMKTLRLLALIAQGVAAWLFFCLFRRQLGSLAAGVGVLALLATANMAELHRLALPNHFVMAMSLAAFASAAEGIRRNRRPMYLLSAVLAGLLPWMMVHAALASLAIAALALSGAWSRDRWAGSWLAVAALPSVVVVGAYALWGPFEVFVRTVLLAPLDFLTEGLAKSPAFLPDRDALDAGVSPQMVHYVVLLLAGVACLPGMVCRASPGSLLRLSPYLILPPILPLTLMASLKGGAPEYWIDAAPAAGFLAAIAMHRLFALKAWTALDGFRYLPAVLRGCMAVYLGLVLAVLTGSGKATPDPPLPVAYCEAASWWIERLEPERTVLDTSALCSYWMLKSDASLHPPFTFTDNWFRQLHTRWIGRALAGDDSETAAAERLRAAIGPASPAGIILADSRLCAELRQRSWQAPFFRHWRLAWFRTIDGYGPEDRFSALAVFVRRDAFLDARGEWLEACGDGCVRAKEAE